MAAKIWTYDQKNVPVNRNVHASEVVQMYPESFNQLRKEIVDNWPDMWPVVGWSMAFAFREMFMTAMNEAFRNGNIDEQKYVASADESLDIICQRYLDGLRAMRGVSALNPSSHGK